MDKKKSLAALIGAAFGLAAVRAVDLALIGATLATAVGTVGFAGYMTLRGDHEPHINGIEYLAIFAQPRHVSHPADKPPVDMNPVGAIGRDDKTQVAGYSLVGAQASYAWLRSGDRIFAVRPGDDVEKLGHVAAIEQRDGRWALIDDKGAALIVSAFADLTPTGSVRFGKKMIFGDGK